jgi:hypothetical protein
VLWEVRRYKIKQRITRDARAGDERALHSCQLYALSLRSFLVHSLVLSRLTATIFYFKCRHFNVLWWCNYGVFTIGAASHSGARGGLCVPSSKTSSFVSYLCTQWLHAHSLKSLSTQYKSHYTSVETEFAHRFPLSSALHKSFCVLSRPAPDPNSPRLRKEDRILDRPRFLLSRTRRQIQIR